VGKAVSASRTLDDRFGETPKPASETGALPGIDCGRVLVITGAGVSAESGIPTFRGKDGYWRNLDPAKLATPAAFERDPHLVWRWYRERRQRIRHAQPNAGHQAIVRLAAQSRDFMRAQNGKETGARQKRWSRFTETFLSRAVRAAILVERTFEKMRKRFRNVRNAMPLCDRAWFGSVSSWIRVKSRGWKLISIEDLATR
jgi:hypothetical protein